MPLPNLLIAGAQKSATTWLHQALRKSSRFQASKPKELNFFLDPDYASKINNYAAHFPTIDGVKYAYESSPEYFQLAGENGDIAARIATTIPKAEIVVILRNPVDRYLSAYTHHMMKSRYAYTPVIDVADPSRNMLDFGRYGAILQHWRQVLPQVHVYFFDDFLTDKSAFFGAVLRDLGVENDVSDDDLDFAVNAKARKFKHNNWPEMPRLSNRLRAELHSFYHDDIVALEQITGRDLSAWKTG
tara:strand:+ start:644 stop:1375 length:732 start_codon:yes stop_codon:yes gene_type:complete